MDIASILGLVSGIVFILLSIFIGAKYNFAEFARFYDPPSIMITVGGTVAATLLSNPLPRILTAFKAVKFVFSPPKVDATLVINQIIQLSNLARKEGLLELEETTRTMNDPFLLKGIMLIADGADAELVHNVLETEMAYIETRHSNARSVWEFIGSSAPAWGMVGTLIGLVLMLGQMQEIEKLGPNMAVAIITTFYGSVIANFIAIPMANKLKIYSNEEMLIKELQIEGMLSILNGEYPRNIEEKLKAFVSPAIRSVSGADAGKDGKGAEGDE